ncbi:MAG: TonB-dependent receptor [Sphingomonadales bacterium]|nr:TonB-dependent receptor [Sphingomonadales bacterium]
MKKLRGLKIIAAPMAIGFFVQPAMAQTSPTSSGAAVTNQNDVPSQDIIVTAQRRNESAMNVPLSIQATSGENLQNRGIKDITSLRFNTPGLTTASDSGFVQMFIRGVGNTIYVGADPAVAYFVDDVPRIYGSMADNFVDVERLEVLKGAQGGLYGRNATGGVVNVITRKPDTKRLVEEVRASYGEKNTFSATGFVNLPINETMAISISAAKDSHDPYVSNEARRDTYTAAMFPSGSFIGSPAATAAFFNGSIAAPALNDQDFWAIRGKLLIKPASNLQLLFSADYSNKQDDNGRAQTTDTPLTSQAALVGLFSSLGITTNFPANLLQAPPGKFRVAMGANGYLNTREYGFSGVLTLNLPGWDVTSISAYRNQNVGAEVDALGSTVPAILIPVDYRKHFFYQELRTISTFEGPFHLLAGATYLHNVQDGATHPRLLSETIPIGDTASLDVVKNWSIYAQGEYDLGDRWSILVSGRYIQEVNNAKFTLPIASSEYIKKSKFVPSATINYKLDNGTAYIRWARGWKTGGIDLVTAPVFYPRPEDGSVFSPETVDTYEVGFKNAFLDRKLLVNIAAFYNDYRDLQVAARSTDPSITTAVVNARSARTWGVEGSASLKASDVLTLGVNAGYLNAKYKDFSLSGSAILIPFNRSGQQMIMAPNLQLAFNVDLDQPLNDVLHLTASALVSHTSENLISYSAVPGVYPDLKAPGYWLANARIGVRTSDGRYSVALVADNLFNAVYYISGNAGALGNGRYLGNPRIVRAEVRVKF